MVNKIFFKSINYEDLYNYSLLQFGKRQTDWQMDMLVVKSLWRLKIQVLDVLNDHDQSLSLVLSLPIVWGNKLKI